MLCRLRFAGHCEVPLPWRAIADEGVNRLYYIHGGNGGYYRGGSAVNFKEGMLYLLPSFSNVPVFSDRDDRIVHTYANFELVPPVLSRDVLMIDPHENPVTESVFSAFLILACKAMNHDLSDEDRRMLVATVEYLTARIVESCGSSLLNDEAVNRALGIMINRMDEKLTIADIARECYMSVDGFIRRFTRVVGVTPYAYYKRLKLRAALAMRESGFTLEVIAEHCGYSDSSALLHALRAEKQR